MNSFDESPKEGKAHGTDKTNLATAMVNHVFFNRTKGMTPEDIQYAKEILDDSIFNDFSEFIRFAIVTLHVTNGH